MSRPPKVGLDYFPLDTVPNWQWEALDSKFENDGIAWYVRFLQKAYRTTDGTVKVSGLFGELLAKHNHITPERQNEIVSFCCNPEIGLAVKLDDGNITSNGVQKRIAAVSKERAAAIRRSKEKSRVEKRRVEESRVEETSGCLANNGDSSANNKKKKSKTKVVLDFDALQVSQRLRERLMKWSSMRESIKAPIHSQEALVLQLAKLNKLSAGSEQVAIEILNESIMNSWQGLFPLKSNRQQQNQYGRQEVNMNEVIETLRQVGEANGVL